MPDLVTPHNDIPAEMPGVRLESDMVPETTAVEQPREPTMAQRATHVRTGVIDMSEDANDSDSDDEEPPRLPDGSNSDSDSDEEPESDKASSRVKEEVIVEDVDDDDDDDPPEAQASEPRDIP